VAHLYDVIATRVRRGQQDRGWAAGRRAYRSVEAALATAQPAAAAGAPLRGTPSVERTGTKVGRGSEGGGSAASRSTVAAAAAAFAIAEGRPGAAGARAAGPGRTVLGLVHAQGPSLEVAAVHGGDALLRRIVVLELHEGEAAGAARLAIGGQLGVDDLAYCGECLEELVARDVEAQIADEDLVRNDDSLLASTRCRERSNQPSRKAEACLAV
jgi:hypothetical protein